MCSRDVINCDRGEKAIIDFSYCSLFFDDTVSSLQHVLCADEAVYPSSLWGPSLDQLDHVVERCLLPELSVGDWLLFSNMGACGLEEFSSSQLSVYYTVSTSDW